MKYNLHKYKMVTFIISLIMLSASISAHADNVDTTANEKPIIDVIKEQRDVDSTNIIFNRELYSDEILHYYISPENAILTTSVSSIWEWGGYDVDVAVEKSRSTFNEYYYVFDEVPLVVGPHVDGTSVGIREIEEPIPTFIQDIIDSTIYQSELHTPGDEYTKIVCLDGNNMREGTTVYYMKDTGTIVRYYPDYLSPAVDYVLEDFQKYAAAYWEYVLACNHGYENTGPQSFLDFVAAGGEYTASDYADTSENENSDRSWVWITVGIGISVAAVLAGAAGIMLYRKRKKQVA